MFILIFISTHSTVKDIDVFLDYMEQRGTWALRRLFLTVSLVGFRLVRETQLWGVRVCAERLNWRGKNHPSHRLGPWTEGEDKQRPACLCLLPDCGSVRPAPYALTGRHVFPTTTDGKPNCMLKLAFLPWVAFVNSNEKNNQQRCEVH